MWTPDPAKIITAEMKVAEAQASTVATFQSAIQSHVDSVAVSKNYDSGNSLASYISSTNPEWSAEAATFVAWRDNVWIYAYAELERVMIGEREVPTVENFIDELPVIEWSE